MLEKLRFGGLAAAIALVACLAGTAGTAGAAGAAGAADAANAPKSSGPAAAPRALDPRSAGAAPPRYQPDRFAGNAGKYYWAVWGIDSLNVRLTESGELIRFSYRVLDPAKAKVLTDKGNDASMIAPEVGVSLVVPQMEKIGPLRQAMTPETGRSYWVAFSNRGRLVKRGDRVDVVIGTFQARNLVVD